MNRREFVFGTLASAGLGGCETKKGRITCGPVNTLGKILGKLPPGRYDSHIHVRDGRPPEPEKFAASLSAAGLRGAILLSEDPDPLEGAIPDPEKAMNNVIGWCAASPTVYPFYWIEPTRRDALDLVDLALEKGIYGFKVIPGRFYPGDERAMPVYEKIAKARKPLLFHSGILWDGRNSSRYTRPGNWEDLIDVAGLRFCLAHVSWPWCEECVAVYGKFMNTCVISSTPKADMFIDTTPGTPRRRREAVLNEVFGFDYDVTDRVMFGTDCWCDEYSVKWSKGWREYDTVIYDKLGPALVDKDSVFRLAMQAFLFGGGRERKLPTQDGE